MVVIIYAHPDPKSFNHAMLETVKSGLTAQGRLFQVIDLYAENFNPVMNAAEVKGEVTEETRNYQVKIKNADSIVFIFPVWWFRAPAILEGFCDKVFTPGFAYRFKKNHRHLRAAYTVAARQKSKSVYYTRSTGITGKNHLFQCSEIPFSAWLSQLLLLHFPLPHLSVLGCALCFGRKAKKLSQKNLKCHSPAEMNSCSVLNNLNGRCVSRWSGRYPSAASYSRQFSRMSLVCSDLFISEQK